MIALGRTETIRAAMLCSPPLPSNAGSPPEVLMKRFNPLYGIVLVVAFSAAVLGAQYALHGGSSDFTRVGPDKNGQIQLEVGDLQPNQVRFYRFLNAGNQEVKFFVGRDGKGRLQVAFDASQSDYKRKRGFRHQGEWLVNNKCDTAIRLAEVSDNRGGCAPVPLAYTLAGEKLTLTEPDILDGWRFFR
jgi:uncharacterized membrane protein